MKHYILSGITVWISLSVYGQWECPSQLGGSLKPAGNSKILWGTEITGAAGYLAKNSIYNAMGLLGLDYTSGSSTFYAEGGFKYWYRTDHDLNTGYHNARWGLRELYYQNNSFGNLTLGLQSMRLDDNYLLNERVVGVNYKKNFSGLALNVFGGSVSRDFSRNGTFCNVAYLYDILPYSNHPLVGTALGQTNMAGFTLGYSPASSPASDDGLGFSPEISSSFVSVENMGFVLYTEFGNRVTKSPVISGFYSNIKLGNEYWFKPEILYQQATDNRAIIYTAKVQKSYTLAGTHRLMLEADYYGIAPIDKGAQAVNLFSNIFAGSVLRLDAPDLSFFQAGVKYTIHAAKANLKLQYTRQTTANPNSETDIVLGKKFFGKLLMNATYGYIKSPVLLDNPGLFRIEMRLDI